MKNWGVNAEKAKLRRFDRVAWIGYERSGCLNLPENEK